MTESEFPYAQGLLGIVNPYKISETETEAEYFESLGRFIASYASAEASIHEL
jgi:hypothetical protein